MIPVLAGYFLASLAFAVLCGFAGRAHHPLAAFQVYAAACAACLAVSLIGGRLLGVWRWRRIFPPTANEALTAASSVLILTSSTLAMLAPHSVTAAVAMRAGALLLVASRRALLLPLLAAAAAALSACTLPDIAAAPVPLGLAAVYVFGYWLKIRATRGAPAAADFLAAEQLVVGLLCLAVGGLFSHAQAPAPLSDLRLWGVAAASTAAGLLGTRLLLRSEPASVTFSAYKATGLLAAACASIARGDRLGAGAWAAFALALAVVVVAARRAKS